LVVNGSEILSGCGYLEVLFERIGHFLHHISNFFQFDFNYI